MAALVTLGTLLLLLAACGGQATPIEESFRSVRGVVTEVEPATIIEVTSLTIVDEEGRTWSFRVEGFLEMTSSHLLQHSFLGNPVTVYHRVAEDGALVAVRVTD